MKQQIIQRIIEDAKRGDFGLVSSLIGNVPNRVLYQKLPQDFKQQVAETFIGEDLFVIQTLFDDGSEEIYETTDEIEAYVQYNELTKNKDIVIIHRRVEINGGNEVNGWDYDLENSELIQTQVLDENRVPTKTFKARIVVEVDGLVLGDTETSKVHESISMEMLPIFISPEFIKSFSRIMELDLEM